MEENCPKQRSDLTVRTVENEKVALDRQGNFIHHLNQTAAYIWECCDGTSSEAAIARKLTQEFDVNPKTAEQDVAAVILQLHQLNLLEPAL